MRQESKQTTMMVKIGPREEPSVCLDRGRQGSVLKLKASTFRSPLTLTLLSIKSLNDIPCSMPGKTMPNLASFSKTWRVAAKRKSRMIIAKKTTLDKMTGKL